MSNFDKSTLSAKEDKNSVKGRLAHVKVTIYKYFNNRNRIKQNSLLLLS